MECNLLLKARRDSFHSAESGNLILYWGVSKTRGGLSTSGIVGRCLRAPKLSAAQSFCLTIMPNGWIHTAVALEGLPPGIEAS